MSNTANMLAEAPSVTPTETTPPIPTDVTPRTEQHDWIFVGSCSGEPAENPPPRALWARDPADLEQAVRTFVMRERDDELYPYIFLAPALAEPFQAQAVAMLLTEEKKRLGWPSVAWHLVADWTAADAAWAKARGIPGWAKETPGGKTVLAAAQAAEQQQYDAMFSKGPALDTKTQAEIREWYGRELCDAEVYPLRRGTLGAQLEAAYRQRVTSAGFYPAEQPEGGWHILLVAPNRYKDPRLKIANGTALRPEKQFQELLNDLAIAVKANNPEDWDNGEDSDEDEDRDEDERPSRRQTSRRVVLRSAAELLADQDTREPPRAVLPYLAWPGRLSLLAAREKDGKSTLVGSGVAALTRGGTWLGQATTPTTVLWFYEEPDRDFKARLQQFGADLSRVFPVRLPLVDHEHDLQAALAQVQPGLVVIDSLIRYAGHAITNASDSTQWARVLTPLATLAHRTEPPGPAILVLHHAGKKDGEYRDSTEIGAAVDMLLQMPRGIERGNRQRLDVVGRIVGIERYTITVELAGTAHQLVTGNGRAGAVNAPAPVISDQDHTVLDALVGTMRYSDWFAASGLRSKSTFSRSIQRLAGMIDRTKDGQYRRLNRP